MVPTLDSPFPVYRRYLPGHEAPVGVMHVVDRVVGRQFLLGPEEKDFFRDLMHRILPFSGLELLTWICLDNHYHLLIRVPNDLEAERLRDELSEEEIFTRMKGCFSPQYIKDVRWRVDAFRRDGKPEMADTIIQRLKAQMFDISAFMHMLKRRFSAWYNRKHGRKGTLWEGRFRSVLVEESAEALLRMAAYIDLNAVRAGVVTDPKDYRWSGYAEAVAGKKEAQQGIGAVVALVMDAEVGGVDAGDVLEEGKSRARGSRHGWDEVQEVYRCWLFDGACEVRDENGKLIRKGVSQEEVERVRAARGRLTRGQLLHCRVRYFADGVAIGSRGFVEGVFDRYRNGFGPNRETGARPLRYGDWAGICSLRDLQKEVIRGPG